MSEENINIDVKNIKTDIKTNLTSIINSVYTKNGYLDRYGGSIFITLFILIGFALLMTYLNLQNTSELTKKNWAEERCKPLNMPFAGLIMKPSNMTASEYTVQNFTFCIQNIFSDIMAIMMIPIQYMMVMISASMSQLFAAINGLRIAIANFRTGSGSSTDTISKIFQNISTSYMQTTSQLQGFLEKSNGVFTTSIFIGVGVYQSIVAALKKAINGAILFIVILCILTLLGWLAFFALMPGLPWTLALLGWKLAAAVAWTIFLLVFIILFSIVISFINNVMERSV